MSMLDLKATMIGRIEEMFDAVGGNSSDADCKAALKLYQMSHYSDLASLAWFLGCDADVFQREAMPASDIVDDAYFDLDHEREFERPAFRQPYSSLNHSQQGISR